MAALERPGHPLRNLETARAASGVGSNPTSWQYSRPFFWFSLNRSATDAKSVINSFSEAIADDADDEGISLSSSPAQSGVQMSTYSRVDRPSPNPTEGLLEWP